MKELKTLDEFQAFIKEGKVAIDFTASWCPPCKMIGPKFEALQNEFPGIKFAKVDVDVNSDTASKVGIQAMPTFQFYNGGSKVDELVGASEEQLKQKLAKLNS